MIKQTINWMTLARLPFHIAGILPFILGGILAWHITGNLNWAIMLWSILAVEFILLTVHFASEYFDYEVDSVSAKLGKNRFSGGSQILQKGIISKKKALIASFISIIPALFIGLLLQFYYKTNFLTLPLGIIGLILGLSYSVKPIRLAYRGFGEIIVGFCYGWLTLATAYYLQVGSIPAIVHLISLPLGFSIFNVILINEFSDYHADREARKNNLVVRFGWVSMSKLYALINLAICISYGIAVIVGTKLTALLIFSPIILISILTSTQVLKGKYQNSKKLESICARTLIINLGVSISLILTILIWN